MIRLSTLIVMSTLTCLGSAVARADDAAVHSIVVRYSDLDLNNARGVAILYGRIRSAAFRVCRDFEGRSLVFQESYAACIRQSISRALTDVDRSSVSAYAAVRRVWP